MYFAEETPAQFVEFNCAELVKWAKIHRDVIARFGPDAIRDRVGRVYAAIVAGHGARGEGLR